MVENGCKIDERNDMGKTALAFAFRKANYHVCVYLLEIGCNQFNIEINGRNDTELYYKILKRIEQIYLCRYVLEEILQNLDLGVIHEIMQFTYDLDNLKNSLYTLKKKWSSFNRF